MYESAPLGDKVEDGAADRAAGLSADLQTGTFSGAIVHHSVQTLTFYRTNRYDNVPVQRIESVPSATVEDGAAGRKAGQNSLQHPLRRTATHPLQWHVPMYCTQQLLGNPEAVHRTE
jgi:hypothetical protein